MFGKKLKKKFDLWLYKRLGGLALFNILLMLMVLLRSAGYFAPFFPLSINTIVLLSMIMGIVLLGFREKELFVSAIVFLTISAVFRALAIEIWAERSSIYTYQAMILAVLISFSEVLLLRFRK